MKSGGSLDNVIALDGRRPMAPGTLREVEAYWTALADGRLMPRRAEVDPRGLTGALNRIFLIEQIAPRHARFRVAGNRLSRLLEMDLRGMPVTALFHPSARDAVSDALEALFAEPARIGMKLVSGSTGFVTRKIQADLLLLPLRDDHGDVTRAIGVLDWTGPVSPPQRFRIAHQERRTLIGYGEAPAPEMPLAPAHVAENPPGTKGRPTLTLVT